MSEYVYSRADFKLNMDMSILKMPITAYLKITDACMLNCTFCSQRKNKNNMELDFCKNILLQLKKNGIVNIYYTGGEPLMHPNIADILKYGYELGFNQVMITNGILLNNTEILNLLQYVNTIAVSMHGTEKMHNMLSNADVYNKIVSNLRIVQQKYEKMNININCTVTNENCNYENILHVAKLCKDNKYNCNIARLNYIGNAAEYNVDEYNINLLLKIVHSLNEEGYCIQISNCIAECICDSQYRYLVHGCGAGYSICAIENNGDVKICASSYKSIGNLHKDSFKNIWSKRKIVKLKSNDIPIMCKNCKSFLKCKGGCKIERQSKYVMGLTDAFIENEYNNTVNILLKEKIKLNARYIRREGTQIEIVSNPVRIINSNVLKLIKIIDGKKNMQEILNCYSNSEKDIIAEIVVNMYKDNIIFVEGGTDEKNHN